MAKVSDNIVMKNVSGQIGKQLVFRRMNGKTVVGKYPNRSHVVYTEEQIQYRLLFAKASAYASSILKDPAKKAAYKTHGETSVYHSALKDYMQAHRLRKNEQDKNPDLSTPAKQGNGIVE